jgi:hypothetical protein
MKPNNEMKEILNYIEQLEEAAKKEKTLKGKEKILSVLTSKKTEAGKLLVNAQTSLEKKLAKKKDADEDWDKFDAAQTIYVAIEKAEEHVQEIVDFNRKNNDFVEVEEKAPKGRFTFVGDFFRRMAEKKQEEMMDEFDDEETKNPLKVTLIRAGIVLGVAAVIGVGAHTVSSIKEERAKKAELEAELEEYQKSQEEAKKKLDEMAKAEQERAKASEEEDPEQLQEEKEEKIVKLAQDLANELNKHEDLNVTFEQSLSLFIHLNVGNSYVSDNEYALDAITRRNLIKEYYVGLTKGTDEFDSYTITDDDLSKLSADVYDIRNAAMNRIIVLNDEKNYEESKEIIEIFKGYITESELQDEVEELTTSIQNMQTSDKKQLKEEVYRYYNYIFAGAKSDVRNFDDYGHYTDADNNEMTFENQGVTMRFYTWFMDGFVSINLSNDLIPQDIINSAQAKLLDQATLLRMLGFKNCSAFNAYYGIDFDNAIDNRTTTKSKVSSSSSSKSNYATATGDAQLDADINQGLLNNSAVGSSFTTSDGSTVTVVESGSSSTTVVVEPDPSTAVTEDQTPSGPSEREETTGGGNEQREEIDFKEDPTEEIIEEGGEVIQPNETTEEISVEKDEISVENDEIVVEEEASDSASIRDEINKLFFLKQAILGEEIVPGHTVYIEEEKGFEKTLSC